uniref:Uncharacterized protein n=1 Tax=Schistosoma japonicum TaxID=6182 RepID=Q5DGU7_SCHJA|nr:unknown [Schistosoma japonicum]
MGNQNGIAYPELVEIDNNNLKKALKIEYDKKQDTSQMEPNLIEILNFDVQTTKPDVPSSRPTSTPVTIGKTVSVHTVAPDVSSSKPTGTSVTDVKTIVIIQVLSYYSETIKSVDDLSMKWFYIYRTLDDSRKFRKACMLYMSLIKRWVPKHFQQSKCNDVKSEVVQRNVNISSVKTLSEFK